MKFLLKESTARRVQALLAQGPGEDPPHPSRGFISSWNPVLVKCLSATAAGMSGVGAQCFSAEVVKINSHDTTQEVGALVWLTVLDEVGTASTPDVDRVYLGLYAGKHDEAADNRSRVFCVPAGAGSSSTGACDLAGLLTTDCVAFTSGGTTVIGENTAPGVWTSTDTLTYPSGSGVAELTIAAGVVVVTVGGMELIPCGNGCWKGGPVTGHAADEGGACAGETFRVCVSCAACAEDPDALTCETAILAEYGVTINTTVPAGVTWNYRLDAAGTGTHSWDLLASDDSLGAAILVPFVAITPCDNQANGSVVFGDSLGNYAFPSIAFSPASMVLQINNGDTVDHTFQIRFNV